MKDQLFLALGTIRANPISGSALNLFQLVHLLPETGISLDLYHEKKDINRIEGGDDRIGYF
jgi:hypothetical protein